MAATKALILEHGVERRILRVLHAIPASSLQHWADGIGTWSWRVVPAASLEASWALKTL